jgi:hypothetical protein
MPIEKGRSADYYDGALNVMVTACHFLEEEFEKAKIKGEKTQIKAKINDKFLMTALGAFSARCAELLIDARLRNA